MNLGADPFELTPEGENCLHLCSEQGHLNLLQYLIKSTRQRDGFLNSLLQRDIEGKAPLHKAAWINPKTEIVRELRAHSQKVGIMQQPL